MLYPGERTINEVGRTEDWLRHNPTRCLGPSQRTDAPVPGTCREENIGAENEGARASARCAGPFNQMKSFKAHARRF